MARTKSGNWPGRSKHYLGRLADFVEREKEFTASASHELRNGVAVISSTVELLLGEDHAEPTRSRLHRLERSTRHMTRLIEALLLLAREPGGGEELAGEGQGYEVAPVLSELVAGRNEAVRDRDCEVRLRVLGHPELRVQPEALVMVVGNLIDNALIHAESRVEVVLDQDGVSVEDEGPGISEHELPYVFQRAYRGRSSHGAGLGLAIVRRLCERHGWRIDLRTRPEKGIRVRVGFAE